MLNVGLQGSEFAFSNDYFNFRGKHDISMLEVKLVRAVSRTNCF